MAYLLQQLAISTANTLLFLLIQFCDKPKNVSKLPMWNKPLQTFMIGVTMVASLSLSACNSDKKNTAEDVAATISGDAPASEKATSDSTVAQSDLDGAVTEQGIPVSYDLASWNKGSVKPIQIDALDDINATFGKVVSKDENSLDYASNPATKYRFMTTKSPYLDVIDSQKYLELGWYYANPTDSDEEKQQSKSHAKKAYKVARQLMGDEGGKLLADMLNGQIIKNQTIGSQKIELAKCEFYSCMLILSKAGAST